MASASKPTTTSSGQGLFFGFEIETILSLHAVSPKTPKKWTDSKGNRRESPRYKDFEKALISEFNKTNTLFHYNHKLGPWDGEATYENWILMEDGTILESEAMEKSKDHYYFPAELVAPVMPYGSGARWKKDIVEVFQILDRVCASIEPNDSCGFHVHLSPEPTRVWTVPELQSICKAIVYFEPAMTTIHPTHRNGSFWAKTHSNEAKAFSGKDMAVNMKEIDKCKTIKDIIDLMNTGKNGEVTRYWAWNFDNLGPDQIGTIEWRQPAAIKTAKGCIAWVELAVAFVNAARGGLNCTKFPGTVAGLKAFIEPGHGQMDSAWVNSIFNENITKASNVQLKAAKPPTQEQLMLKTKGDRVKALRLEKVYRDWKIKQASIDHQNELAKLTKEFEAAEIQAQKKVKIVQQAAVKAAAAVPKKK